MGKINLFGLKCGEEDNVAKCNLLCCLFLARVLSNVLQSKSVSFINYSLSVLMKIQLLTIFSIFYQNMNALTIIMGYRNFQQPKKKVFPKD